jgi:acetyltransferase
MKAKKPENMHGSPDFSAYSENWASRNGIALTLRAITSDDKLLEKELIDGISTESSRYRFFHVVKEATADMISKFCDIDYKNEIAIIAEYDSNGKKQNVGVLRLCLDPGLASGEFALLITDTFQDDGLGTKFMDILIVMGRKKGLKSIYGIVLSDNNKMLTLVKEYGFTIGPNSDGEVKVTLQL